MSVGEWPSKTMKAEAMQNTIHLMSENEAAKYLGVAPKTLQRWRWAGHPPSFVKIGARVGYRQDDLNAFIESGKVER